jgi:6-phosphogluconolactonase
MPAETGIRVHTDVAGVAEDALGIFRREVESAVRSRGRAGIAIPGGQSPHGLFERLAGGDLHAWSCWGLLHVFWTDERAVDPAHVDSNYRLAREAFLERVPIPEGQVHRLRGEAKDLDAEAARYARLLEPWSKGGRPRLDLIVLGIGADGHTASLFPGSPALAERERWVAAAPGPPPQERRLTMTYPALNGGRAILFLAMGEDKAAAVARALAGNEPVERVPAKGVRPEDGKLFWILDQAAAARLGRPLGVPDTHERPKRRGFS